MCRNQNISVILCVICSLFVVLKSSYFIFQMSVLTKQLEVLNLFDGANTASIFEGHERPPLF